MFLSNLKKLKNFPLATYFKFFGFLQEISDNWNVIMKDDNIELLKKEVNFFFLLFLLFFYRER